MHEEIKELRRRLPKRHYVSEIKKLIREKEGKRISTSQIHNFFNYRSVNEEHQILIIKGANYLIKKVEKVKDEKKRLLKKQ